MSAHQECAMNSLRCYPIDIDSFNDSTAIDTQNANKLPLLRNCQSSTASVKPLAASGKEFEKSVQMREIDRESGYSGMYRKTYGAPSPPRPTTINQQYQHQYQEEKQSYHHHHQYPDDVSSLRAQVNNPLLENVSDNNLQKSAVILKNCPPISSSYHSRNSFQSQPTNTNSLYNPAFNKKSQILPNAPLIPQISMKNNSKKELRSEFSSQQSQSTKQLAPTPPIFVKKEAPNSIFSAKPHRPVVTNVVSPFSFRGVEMRFIDDEMNANEGIVVVDNTDNNNDEMRVNSNKTCQNVYDQYLPKIGGNSSKNSSIADHLLLQVHQQQPPQSITPGQKISIQKIGNSSTNVQANSRKTSPIRGSKPVSRMCRTNLTNFSNENVPQYNSCIDAKSSTFSQNIDKDGVAHLANRTLSKSSTTPTKDALKRKNSASQQNSKTHRNRERRRTLTLNVLPISTAAVNASTQRDTATQIAKNRDDYCANNSLDPDKSPNLEYKSELVNLNEPTTENFHSECFGISNPKNNNKSRKHRSGGSGSSSAHDDTGIDSSGCSTTSSLDFRDEVEPLKTGSVKRPSFNSSFSSMESSSSSLSPKSTPHWYSAQFLNSKFQDKDNFEQNANALSAPHSIAASAAELHQRTVEEAAADVESAKYCVIGGTDANVIRRKLSAHSKVKNKRTSVLLQPNFAQSSNLTNEKGENASANANANDLHKIVEPREDTDTDIYDSSPDDDKGGSCLEEEDEPNIDVFSRSSLVVRQQPALRVKAIIDKLLYMSGRDQRRALFSLKSIFQNDKDIVHEFVRNGGLECLVKIGRTSDQNHQNHILRAIGQLMLYVDGMNGIIASNETICWIYQLLDSPYRLVVKTALKLLLVFVEYTESNSLLLLAAMSRAEKGNGKPEWSSLMRILNERQASDEETLVLGMTIVNKTLNGVPDQDTFFDIIDVLEGQGLDDALKTMLTINNSQLTQQCTHYEQELRKEDAALESDSSASNNNNNFHHSHNNDLVKMRVNGNSYSQNASINNTNNNNNNNDRRSDRMRRQQRSLQLDSLPTTSLANDVYSNNNTDNNTTNITYNNNKSIINSFEQQAQKQQQLNGFSHNKIIVSSTSPTPTTTDKQQTKQSSWRNFEKNNSSDAWSRRKDASDEMDSDLASQFSKNLSLNNNSNTILSSNKNSSNEISNGDATTPTQKTALNGNSESIVANGVDDKENIQESMEEEHHVKAPPPCIPTNIFSPTEHKTMVFPEPAAKDPEESPAPETAKPKPVDSDDDGGGACGFAALLQKRAKKMENSAFRKGIIESSNRQSESEVKWKEAAEKLKEKPMIINDLDFSGFVEFEQDPLVMVKVAQVAQDRDYSANSLKMNGGVPPAPPPIPGGAGGPRGVPPPPPAFGANSLRNREQSPGPSAKSTSAGGTLKLHWKPAQAEAPQVPALKRKGNFWNQMEITPQIDISKLSRLFEQKPKEVPVKKAGGELKPQVLQVLSVKRSQAINIGLTKLPPITVIPAAIRKFDASVLNKEGIEKILSTMMPSSEEVERIHERQGENPDTPLGQAEQFMLSLSEIDCLLERLRLWLFMLDYQNLEKDVAESLMELNNAMKEIEESKTFRVAMGMLLTIGNALNGTEIKAFQLDYLSRASEVKDPVHKYPLTHHLAEYMIDNFPEGTDLYSELGAVSRSSRLDFDAVLDNLKKMETDCKACFDYVAKISQRDNNSSMKNKVNVFLTEVAERIHRLKHVHRATIHRWNAFLLYFGYAPAEVKDQKPISVFKMVIEFALEYRTNRDKILQMRKRMAEKRERNKTRGMMIGAAQASATTTQNGFIPTGSASRGGRVEADSHQMAASTNGIEKIMSDRQRHEEMSRLLTNSSEDASTLTLGRRRAGQPTPERALIAAQTDALRKASTVSSNGFNVTATECADDELLDGVVRTVTAQADSRDHNRRRARLFNRKSLRRTRTIRQDQLVELSNLSNY